MACVAVASLVRTMELEFLNPQPRPIVQENKLIFGNKDLIESLHKKLGFLIELFDENRTDGVEAIKYLEIKFRDVAFRTEDEIELQVLDLYEEEEFAGITNLFGEKQQGDIDVVKTRHSLRFHHILLQAIDDTDAIKEELMKVKMEYKRVIALQGRKTNMLEVFQESDEDIMMGDSSEHTSQSEDIMVGKNNEFKTIKKMLIQHPSKYREVVSIKGMGGIGKTTLARQVYEDPSIASHFDKRGWVVASQHHNKKQMLLGLLNQMGNEKCHIDEELALQLYQCLKSQRYLVVVDDVWSGEAWDAIKACFPDDRNGSRVLLTTRLAEVAIHTGSNNDFSHQMHLLDQNESWNLFRTKACGSRGVKFEKIGRPIVGKCKGLPLAIVVVAGLFSKLNTIDEWKDTAKALNTFAKSTISEACSQILSLSYNHLPYNLKACFLYLGIFPEDHEINANELARLWFTEGLVKASENETFDVVAKRHMQELMDRNLLLVSRQSCCGRAIKAFRVHDLLHSFCVKEARKENLLHVISKSGSNICQKGFRWLSIQSKDFDASTLYSASKSYRSIFYFLKVTSLKCEIFSLLRVIYFNDCHCICKKIVDLVHLRYLPPVLGDFNISKLFKAWNLQILSICADDETSYLEFPQLHHFHCYYIRGLPPHFVHQNLQSISWLKPHHCTKEFFTNIPYLKKVRTSGGRRDCNDCIANLAYSQQLERLCIYASDASMDLITINKHIVFLKNLTKLKFKFMNFDWKGMNVLTKLPRLQVLKLFNFACMGEEWELPETEKFCELIVLDIGTADLKHWKASVDHFPKLERLILYWCYNLEELPTDFAEIPTLKSIELKQCLPSAVTSAREIEKMQHEYGNHNMVAIEEYTIQPEESVEDERKQTLSKKKTDRNKNLS